MMENKLEPNLNLKEATAKTSHLHTLPGDLYTIVFVNFFLMIY